MARNIQRMRETYNEAFYDTPIDIRDYALDHGQASLWKGALAGTLGGLIASWAMVQFQKAISATPALVQRHSNASVPSHREQPEQHEDATVRAAERISEKVLHRRLTRGEKKVGGTAVHYGFGAAMGALYGVAAEFFPATAFGFGTVFGSALFVAADEVVVPALGLSKKPQQLPASKHALGLVSHWVWGAGTEGVRRGVRTVI